MPDRRRLVATGTVEADVISKLQGARQLTESELTAYGNQFRAGWHLSGLLNSGEHRLRLLLPERFPFVRPRVAVDPPASLLSWPHLEELGLLCLSPDEAPHSPENPVASVVHAITCAQTLVNDSLEGRGFEQFEDEFVSYWNLWAKAEKPVRSVCTPIGPSRWVSAWHGKAFILFAEDEPQLRTWLESYFDKELTDEIFAPRRVPFIWLNNVPRPTDYPTNVAALLSSVRTDPQSRSLVEDLIFDQRVSDKTVLLGCLTRSGVGLGAIRILKPQGHRRGSNPITKGGFRGMPPKRLVLARYSSASVVGANVIRHDPYWVHGRDQNPNVGPLLSKSVVILGIGSVGSGVAALLAKSGVGKVVLVDPQALEPENTSRHELGADSAGYHKATGLAASLRKRFPHLTFEAHAKPWQEVASSQLELLTRADMVISTLGSWATESELNVMTIDRGSFPPLLYGWTERHATAGHAVVFIGGTECLRCMTNELGELRIPVTSWKGETMKQVPACGGSFQPYGAVELGHIHALIAELALDVLLERIRASLHRTWVGRYTTLEQAGGEWNPSWIRVHNDPVDGGRIIEERISRDDQCPACRERHHA